MRAVLHYCWTAPGGPSIEVRCDDCARADGLLAMRQPEAIHPSELIARQRAGIAPLRCVACKRSYADLRAIAERAL
jgi:hypothetical protein